MLEVASEVVNDVGVMALHVPERVRVKLLLVFSLISIDKSQGEPNDGHSVANFAFELLCANTVTSQRVLKIRAAAPLS